jgi:hypothetical protein
MIADFILPALLVGFLLLAALWVLVPAFHGLPPISASRARIRKALQMADLQPGENLIFLYSMSPLKGDLITFENRQN